MIKKTFISLLFLMISAGFVYAEKLTLTTYYPAPYGAYDRFRLVPRPDFPIDDACDVGMMYVSDDSGELIFCESGTWGGGGDMGTWKETDGGGSLVHLTPRLNADTTLIGLGVTTPEGKLHVSTDASVTPKFATDATNGRLSGDVIVQSGSSAISLIGKDTGTVPTAVKFAAVNVAGDFLNHWALWRKNTGNGGAMVFSYTTGINDFSNALYENLVLDPSGNLTAKGIVSAASAAITGLVSAASADITGTTITNALNANTVAANTSVFINTPAQFSYGGVAGMRLVGGVMRIQSGMGRNDYWDISSRGGVDRGEMVIRTGDNGNDPIIFEQVRNRNYLNYKRLSIEANGDVTIGQEGAVARGLMGAGGNLLAYGDIESKQNITAVAFLYDSDKKLKKNIKPITSALEKIAKLEGVMFTWKESKVDDMGLVAQNVEAVFPNMVSINKTTGMRGVKYGNLVAPLIEAVKEEKEIVEKQGARIDAQEKIIASQAEAIKDLENKIKEIENLENELRKIKKMMKDQN